MIKKPDGDEAEGDDDAPNIWRVPEIEVLVQNVDSDDRKYE